MPVCPAAAKKPMSALVDNGPCTKAEGDGLELGYMVCRKQHSERDEIAAKKLRKKIRDTEKEISSVANDAANRPTHGSENDWRADFASAGCLIDDLGKLNTKHQSIAYTYTQPHWLPLSRIQADEFESDGACVHAVGPESTCMKVCKPAT